MAFNTNTASQNSNTNGNNSKDESWKAVGFINIFLPARDGSRVKLGAIPLKAAKPREAELANWLAEDDESKSRLNLLLNKLEMEYASAEPSDAKGFDLG